MDITLGSTFQKVGSDDVFAVIEVDKVRKTAILKSNTGESKAQCFTTLKDKRRWIALGTPEEEEKIEAPEQPKKAKVRSLGESKEEIGGGFDIKNYVVSTAESLGAEVAESNGRFISLKTDGKMFAAIFSYSKKSLTLGVRGKAIEGKTNPDSTANHMMDARFKFDTLSDSVKELITLILKTALDYQREKNKK